MDSILKKIIASIKASFKEEDSFVDPFSVERVSINASNFVDPSKSPRFSPEDVQDVSKGRMLFVDGGSATLIENPSFIVLYIKVVGLIYEGKKLVSKTKYNLFAHIDNETQNNIKIFSKSSIPEGTILISFILWFNSGKSSNLRLIYAWYLPKGSFSSSAGGWPGCVSSVVVLS